MQNMKNAVLVLTAFLLLFPYKLMAVFTTDYYSIFYR